MPQTSVLCLFPYIGLLGRSLADYAASFVYKLGCILSAPDTLSRIPELHVVDKKYSFYLRQYAWLRNVLLITSLFI